MPSSSWTYHGYGQMGRAYGSYKTQNDPISDNLYRASDAVVNPANPFVRTFFETQLEG